MSLVSLTATLVPIGTPCATPGTGIRDLAGLPGRVCQVNIAPDVVDIQDCCIDGAPPRVQDNCIQYCQTSLELREFNSCVRSKLNVVIQNGGYQCRVNNVSNVVTSSSTGSVVPTSTVGSVSSTGSAPAETSTAAASERVGGDLVGGNGYLVRSFALGALAWTVGFVLLP